MDTIDPTRFIFASFFVLGLLGVFAVALKKFGQKSMLSKYAQTGRINVLETRYIDGKTKLVLIKRDNVEHLLLIGDGKAITIEANTGTKDEQNKL